jgi:pyridoxal phosphate enzyme (YggS family)
VAELIRGLEDEQVRANLARAREQIAAAAHRAGRDPSDVEILAAVKYVAIEELEVLARAGIELVGENRAQELEAKAAAYPGRFTWDFIGHLQSRKVKQILPHVRYIHSVASDSVLEQLRRHGSADTEVLVEVNVAGEPGKSGIAPAELPSFIERCPVRVVGLMTMPPLAASPESSRRYFAALRELAEGHGMRHLSMGTSQDYPAAVEEGATLVRLGTSLYAPSAPGAS